MPVMNVVLPDDTPPHELQQRIRDEVIGALSDRVRLKFLGEPASGGAVPNTHMIRYSVEFDTEPHD